MPLFSPGGSSFVAQGVGACASACCLAPCVTAQVKALAKHGSPLPTQPEGSHGTPRRENVAEGAEAAGHRAVCDRAGRRQGLGNGGSSMGPLFCPFSTRSCRRF